MWKLPSINNLQSVRAWIWAAAAPVENLFSTLISILNHYLALALLPAVWVLANHSEFFDRFLRLLLINISIIVIPNVRVIWWGSERQDGGVGAEQVGGGVGNVIIKNDVANKVRQFSPPPSSSSSSSLRERALTNWKSMTISSFVVDTALI